VAENMTRSNTFSGSIPNSNTLASMQKPQFIPINLSLYYHFIFND